MAITRRNIIVLFLLSGALLSATAYIVWAHQSSIFGGKEGTAYQVQVTQEGFTPRELTIQRGDTVEFQGVSGREIWPASDLHPTHTIYPEFDPKRPIPVGEQWSFRFDRLGAWRYHDHLNPEATGVVVVRSFAEKENKTVPCSGNAANQQECWRHEMEKALNQGGIEGAFERLAAFYNEEPQFRQGCHTFTHLIGQKAYEVFSAGKDITLSPEAAYCGYGFYHGFTEAMLHQTGDLQGARDFCAYAGAQLEGRSEDVEGACYHGIGHGAVDGGDPRAWGDPRALVDPALLLCKKVGSTPPTLERCASGVFNALAIALRKQSYNLVPNRDHPYEFCGQFEELVIREPCYREMNTLVLELRGNNFYEATAFIQQIPNTYDAQQALESLAGNAAYYLRTEPENFPNVLLHCHSLAADLRSWCIRGFAAGLIEFGHPREEHVLSFRFCTLAALTSSERTECLSRVGSYLRVIRPPDQVRELCNGLANETDRRSCGGS